jgi:hypothetical protein
MDLTALQTISANLRDYMAPVKKTVTISGTSYYGVPQSVKQDVKFSEYGYSSGYQFTLGFEVADFASQPADDTEATIDGTVYKIMSVTKDPAGVRYIIDFGSRTA